MNPEEKKETVKLQPKHWFYIFICSGVAIFLIVLFLVPQIIPEKSELKEVEYNYFKFKKVGPVWETLVMHQEKLLQPSFRFLPEEVENVPITGKLNENFGEDLIYLTFDPLLEQSQFQTLAIAVSEMGMNIVKGLEKQIESGCTKNETEACINRTIVDCSDKDKSVILFNSTGTPEVILRENCIELRGTSFDLLKSVDRVLYAWYGILKRNIITPRVQPPN